MIRPRSVLWSLTASLVLLSGCGGGGGGDDGKGAIAVSDSTGKAAIIWSAINQNVANDAARDKCGGGDCKVVLQFSRCGAVSSDFSAGKYAAAEGESAEAAQAAADQACRGKGGKTCSAPADLSAKCN
jgi:Domain of unknown function (DUF4189)